MLLIVYEKGYLGVNNHMNDFVVRDIISTDNPNHILNRNRSEHHMLHSHGASQGIFYFSIISVIPILPEKGQNTENTTFIHVK